MTHVTPQYLAEQGLSQTFPERFWAKVRKTESCWIWTAAKVGPKCAYGLIGTGPHQKKMLAHRASWLLAYGPIPEAMNVLHRCDNPPCVRPDHLFLGTSKENSEDCCRKGRKTTRKLSPDEAKEIRRLYIPWKVTLRELAGRFGVCETEIHRIVHRKTYLV